MKVFILDVRSFVGIILSLILSRVVIKVVYNACKILI